MKKTFLIISLLGLLLGFNACEKEKELQCTLYGTVKDKVTSEPIKNASVELLPTGTKAITGSDGHFEFSEIKEGKYQLYITKTGYKEYSSNSIDVNSKNVSHNVQLELLPPALTIVDDKQNEIDTIDFGFEEGVVMRSFNIFNNSEEKLRWSISHQCDWIKSVEPQNGDLKADSSQTVVITIDRSVLNVGTNSTIVHITSNNGSKQLTIVATSLSVVETKQPSKDDIGSQMAALSANVVRNMNPSITEYGFVYSTSPAPSLVNGAKKISQLGTPQIGPYSMLAEGLTHDTKYYVRAFVTNAQEIIYGEQVDFTTISPRAPKIKITSVQSPVPATSIIIGYEVTDDGGLPLEEVGLCWATHSVVTTDDNHMTTGNEKKKYTTTITGLTPGTLYYFRAYARNADCTQYSTEINRTTNSSTFSVETDQNYSSGTNYLLISGRVTKEEDVSIIRQGVCYSTISSTPTIYDNVIEANSKVSPFTCQITGLTSGTTYYCRAFAENDNHKVEYGNSLQCCTQYAPTIVTGYIKDQDGNPISGATVSGYNVIVSSATTDNNGYYSITLDQGTYGSCKFQASANNFNDLIEEIIVTRGQENQLDFTLNLTHSYAVDIGTGTFINSGEVMSMFFNSIQQSMAGTTTTKNMRIKNYRSVPVSYSITNIPTTGVQFSRTSGSISAKGEVTITIRFTYPSTASQMVSLVGCALGTKTYIWNWEYVYPGYYMEEDGYHEYSCAAFCMQTPILLIGNESESFDIICNQIVTY